MVYYDLFKILLSVPISALWGAVASLLISGVRVVATAPMYCITKAQAVRGRSDFRAFFSKDGVISSQSHLSVFLSPIIFFLVYIILSYTLLYGQIRLYVFLFMLLKN